MNFDYLPRIGYTNGISLKDIRSWKKGNKFVVQKQYNNEWLENPKEIIIHTIEELIDDDLNSVGFNHKIVGECGTIIVISNILMSPCCSDHDIYKNWATYFNAHYNKIKGKKISLKKIELFLEKFYKFEKEFKNNNPEKFI